MKVSKTLQKACQVLRHRMRYKSAGIRLPGSELSDTEKDTAIIREATKIYVESWIVPLLDCIEKGDLRAVARMVEHEHEDRCDPPERE